MRVEPLPIQKRNRPHWIGVYSMQDIAIFVQGEGRPTISLTQVKQDATIEALAVAAIAPGAYHAADGHECLVSLEEADEPLTPSVTLTTAGIGHRSRVHLHRCRKIHVTVSFNGQEKSRAFSPAATIGRVTQWAVGKRGFELDDIDAAEHVLQVTGILAGDANAHYQPLYRQRVTTTHHETIRGESMPRPVTPDRFWETLRQAREKSRWAGSTDGGVECQVFPIPSAMTSTRRICPRGAPPAVRHHQEQRQAPLCQCDGRGVL
jgi:hypothetical protein